MSQDIYEILALGARYWFALLGVLIVWRSFRWLRKDRKAKHRRLKQLPDAGMIGELVVLSGSDQLPEEATLPIPYEGTLGFLRSCDVVVPVSGVAPRHLDFSFQKGQGLLIRPRFGQTATVDGEEVTPRIPARKHPMHHGSRLQVGDAELRLRVFEGLEAPRPAAVMADPEESAEPPADWQATSVVYHQVPAAWNDVTGRFEPIPWQSDGYPPQSWQADPNGYPPQGWQADPNGYPPQGWQADPNGYPLQNWQGDPNGYPPQDPSDPYPPQDWSAPETRSDSVNPTDSPEAFPQAVPRRHRPLFGRRRSHEE